MREFVLHEHKVPLDNDRARFYNVELLMDIGDFKTGEKFDYMYMDLEHNFLFFRREENGETRKYQFPLYGDICLYHC